MDVFLSNLADQEFRETIIWGAIFLGLMVALFVLSKVLRFGIGSQVKGMTTPFGMSAEDIEALKSKGGLNEEELKKIRAAMGRRFKERAVAEVEAKTKPGNAAIVLRALEEKVIQQGADQLRRQEGIAPPVAPMSEFKPFVAGEIPLERIALPTEVGPPVSDMELENMVSAGFITPEELAAIRRDRAQS